MTITPDHVNQIGSQLAHRLGNMLQEGKVSLDEGAVIAEYILTSIDTMDSHEKMIEFLLELNSRWPEFEETLTLEKQQVASDADSRKAAEISQQLKEGVFEATATGKGVSV